MRYESAVNSAGGDDVALVKSFIIACEGPILNCTLCCNNTQFVAGSISRQSLSKHSRYFTKQQLRFVQLQVERQGAIAEFCKKVNAAKILDPLSR
jgi:sulfatase maturation enzyme AslB (radical SAM superfamily)